MVNSELSAAMAYMLITAAMLNVVITAAMLYMLINSDTILSDTILLTQTIVENEYRSHKIKILPYRSEYVIIAFHY